MLSCVRHSKHAIIHARTPSSRRYNPGARKRAISNFSPRKVVVSIYFDRFRQSFREVHAVSNALVMGSLSPKDHALREMMNFVLSPEQPSDYTHVFQYAHCRVESDYQDIVKISAAVHLLQASTFLTDDVFDGTMTRYSLPAVHRKYGASYAIIAAELLQSVAMETIGAELDGGQFQHRCLAFQIFNQMMRELYVGQFLDVFHTGDLRIAKSEYFRIIALAVGNFLAHLARCGALLAGKPASEVEALSSFGYHYGMALFITDDIVDVADRPEVTGKSYAADLRNRRMRLPVILALKMGKPSDVRSLKRLLLKKKELSPAEIEQARGVVLRSGALGACLKIAKRHLAKSVEALATLKESPTTENLRWLAKTLLTAQRLAG